MEKKKRKKKKKKEEELIELLKFEKVLGVYAVVAVVVWCSVTVKSFAETALLLEW